MIDNRKARELAAESIREMGVLVLVFATLDAFFQERAPALGSLSAIIVLALLAIVVGITIEARE